VHADFAIIPVVEGMRVTAVAVYGVDGTESARMKEQMARLAEQHATAMQELQSTNEELETTNEELQSTNEELETTNEELQSTNEELETTVQELQAANDELGAMSLEMDRRRGQTKDADDYQRSVVGSLPWPVVVLDRDGIVMTWNRAAEEIWGLEATHTLQRPFWSIPVGDIAQKMRATLARVTATGVAEIATKIDFSLPTSEQRHLTMQVTPLRNDFGETTGVVGVVTGNDPPA
jgi:two-component system, chemotaxis family, CheB/CheR fusion protein